MRNIETETIINANIVDVWEVLTDFTAYPKWNPFLRKVNAVEGKEGYLCIEAYLMEDKPYTFFPEIVSHRAPSEFRWRGKLFNIGGFFVGEHYFKLQQVAHNQTRLIHGEDFTGILVGLMWSKLQGPTLTAFEAMNAALKNRAEQLYLKRQPAASS